MMLRRIGGTIAAALLALVGALLLLGAGTLGAPAQATACGGAPSISLGTGAIAWPMPAGSYRLTSGYGPRWGSFHHGIDLAAPIGTPMYASHDGVVEEAGPAGGFGLWVVITGTVDGQKVSTVYGHNNRNLVTAGQTVAAGDPIAEVGNRGESTGPHLHFEVWPGGRFGGRSTDPAGWLASNVRDGETTAEPPPAPPADTRADAVDLSGPVPPEGRQATMPIGPEQQANVDTIIGVVKGEVPDDPTTPQNDTLRVAVITIATAMQESGLRVIDYGDIAGPDSRGLYQQRLPWGPYAARMDPVESTRMFLRGGQGGQRGLLSHNWRGMSLEDVVVATQISVGGYAKWETQAMQLVAASAGVEAITGPGAPIAPCTV